MIHICNYGCGQEAKYQFKNGKYCCSKNIAQCPVQRKKNSESKKGENNPFYGKHHNKESKKKMSEAQSRENHPMWNKFHSKETKKKLITPFEKIKKYIENEGFDLLATKEEYENYPKNKLKIRCPKGHIIKVFWNGSKQGIRCRECFEEKQRNPKQKTRRKMRLSRIKDIESKHGQCSPNYNPKACKRMDEYGKENNYNFQHAENGGEYHIKELGYWVDGYDKEKNVVIEIDEPAHFDKDGNLREKDIERQKEITEFLGCKFIRLKI